MILDGDRLRVWLEEQQQSLQDSARERHAADGKGDPTALRMDGGVANIHLILTQLHHFEVHRGGSGRVRATDPDTSHVAAESLNLRSLNRLHTAILRVLGRESMTDDRIREVLQEPLARKGYKYEKTSFTKRRGELVEWGLVRDSGERVLSSTNRPMIVWETVPTDG